MDFWLKLTPVSQKTTVGSFKRPPLEQFPRQIHYDNEKQDATINKTAREALDISGKYLVNGKVTQ